MGEVYLAEDTTLDRKVALKVLPASMAGDPARLERFQREAKAIAALIHVSRAPGQGGRHAAWYPLVDNPLMPQANGE